MQFEVSYLTLYATEINVAKNRRSLHKINKSTRLRARAKVSNADGGNGIKFEFMKSCNVFGI